MIPRSIEILAPAGNADMLCAAVLAGADAVYLGLDAFNARRGADNFSQQGLAEAVSFCHARGAKVYVTLNTIVYPRELAAIGNSLRDIAQAGADAVIVQDLAVAALARQLVPTLALHGSTQMSVHSLAGAQALARLGFARVILSRELSLAEIQTIIQACDIETEVFIHGALCMSVSGQCYMSAFLGGRSGNRGMCAGPCRLPFCADSTAQGRPAVDADGHHLSLKDMSHIAHLPALIAAGVSSVKIEGRLRTPEYAAAAVNACVQRRMGGAYDAQLLQDVFSRSGFTDGYLNESITGAMFGTRTEADSAAAKAALPKLRELFRRERPRVSVNICLTIEPEGSKLALTDCDGNRVVVYSETPAQPSQKDLTESYARALGKTGGTPFYLEAFSLAGENAQSLYLPASAINEMRRAALEQLLQKRGAPKPLSMTEMQNPFGGESADLTFETSATPKQICILAAGLTAHFADGKAAPAPKVHSTSLSPAKKQIYAQFETLTQMPQSAATCDGLILPLAQWQETPDALRKKTWLALPRFAPPAAESRVALQIEAAKAQGFAGFFVQNLAHLLLCKGLPMLGGFGLNIANPVAAQCYAEMGLQAMTLSCESTAADMARMTPQGSSTMALAYGHMPLMLTRACPLQNVHSCNGCARKGVLSDRKGKHFPVYCTAPAGAGVRTVYNPIPIYMGDKTAELAVEIILLSFAPESAQKAAEILTLFRAGKPFPGEFTRGMYFKGTAEA